MQDDDDCRLAKPRSALKQEKLTQEENVCDSSELLEYVFRYERDEVVLGCRDLMEQRKPVKAANVS